MDSLYYSAPRMPRRHYKLTANNNKTSTSSSSRRPLPMANLLFLAFLMSVAGASNAFFDDSSVAFSRPLNLGDLSPYEALQSYNFPPGLLPEGALGYDLDNSTGKFSAYFDRTCSFSLPSSYQLRYQSTISGRISTNRLSDLRGVSVKVLLFWLNIIEVVRQDQILEFSVGIASADFPIHNFYVCPQCGCGLDCAAVGSRVEEGFRVKLKPFI